MVSLKGGKAREKGGESLSLLPHPRPFSAFGIEGCPSVSLFVDYSQEFIEYNL
jgi:hypothetical protein